MVQICEELLQEPQLDLAIRVGDCLAMLVEYFHSIGNMKKSYQYLCNMKDRRILLHPYIDAEVLDDVSRAVGQRLDDNEEDIQDEDEDNGHHHDHDHDPNLTEHKSQYYGRKKEQVEEEDGDDIVDEEELAEVPLVF